MTAVNLIVQSRANAAYLLTDTAQFRPQDGAVAAFASKVMVVEIAGCATVAIGMAGVLFEDELADAIGYLAPGGLEGFLRGFPKAFWRTRQGVAGRIADVGAPGILAALAVFDHVKAEPRGFVITDGRTIDGSPLRPYEPFSLHPALKYLTAYAGRPFPRGTDMCDPRRWSPYHAGRDLLEAQRRDPAKSTGGHSYSAVGGQAVLTRVAADGATHSVLTTWPDKIGQCIDVDGFHPLGALARWQHQRRARSLPQPRRMHMLKGKAA